MGHPEVQDDRQTLLQVVRGERPWIDLRNAGINVQLEGTHCTFENPRHLEVKAGVQDLARGFLAHLHDAHQLREWAFVMMAADFDLDVEGHPAADLLLGALWDASFLNPIGEKVIGTLEQLARDGSE